KTTGLVQGLRPWTRLFLRAAGELAPRLCWSSGGSNPACPLQLTPILDDKHANFQFHSPFLASLGSEGFRRRFRITDTLSATGRVSPVVGPQHHAGKSRASGLAGPDAVRLQRRLLHGARGAVSRRAFGEGQSKPAPLRRQSAGRSAH